MRVPFRLRLPLLWLESRWRGQSAQMSWADVMKGLTETPYQKRAADYITRREENATHHLLNLRGLDRPLHWPKSQPWLDLEGLLVEQLDPRHWHYYLPPETPVTTDDIVADCGASEGIFSLMVIGTVKQVHAIEPTALFQESLRATFGNEPKFTAHKVALGRQPSRVKFCAASLGAHAVEGDGEEVEVVTLDSLFAGQNRPLTFLKADVEGAEPDLIAGAAETIFQNKPKIAITTYHVKEHADQLTEALRKIHPGYRFRRKGFITGGYPVMLHAWMD